MGPSHLSISRGGGLFPAKKWGRLYVPNSGQAAVADRRRGFEGPMGIKRSGGGPYCLPDTGEESTGDYKYAKGLVPPTTLVWGCKTDDTPYF